jgi:hypothetical protein
MVFNMSEESGDVAAIDTKTRSARPNQDATTTLGHLSKIAIAFVPSETAGSSASSTFL